MVRQEKEREEYWQSVLYPASERKYKICPNQPKAGFKQPFNLLIAGIKR